MEFDWTEEDRAFRRELQGFLAETLPPEWSEMAADGPGSDVQAAFAKSFCPKLAERGWLVQNWPAEYGGKDASAWRHIILGEEMWRIVGPTQFTFMYWELRGSPIFHISSPRMAWRQGEASLPP